MTALSAFSGAAAPSLMLASRARVQQARREADRAEAQARDLRTQADEAERGAQQANQTVRSLERVTRVQSQGASATPAPAAPESPDDPRSKADLYASALATAFTIAKPVLEIDLSQSAKNLVLSSVFLATDQFLARADNATTRAPSTPNPSQATVVNLFGQATGGLVNTSA